MITTTVQFRNEIEFLPFWFKKAQKHSDEIICAVNEPNDGSLEWVENYSKTSEIPIKILYFNKYAILDHGFSFIKNKLIEASSGSHIISLDIDEEMNITKEQIKKVKFIARTNTHTPIKINKNYSIKDIEYLKKQSKIHKATHFRIFRKSFAMKWHGYIHEELRLNNVKNVDLPFNRLNNIMWHYTNLRPNKNNKEKNILYAKLLCRIYDNPSLRNGTNEYWYTTYFEKNEKKLRQLSKFTF
jgi:hypothetical protein